ncbi:MAG TPA: hypothetical protein VFB48_02045 [Nitrososphaeraceae archaeon]|nr:hypothetical protein [Nitrososphaeraceae archaeon]
MDNLTRVANLQLNNVSVLIELFGAAIKSPATCGPYETRIISFLRTIGLSPDRFVQMTKNELSFIEKKLISFISNQNARAEKGEIGRWRSQYNFATI